MLYSLCKVKRLLENYSLLELKTWRKPLVILLHGEDDGCSYHVGEDYYSFYINATILEGWRFDSRSQNWEYLDW